MNAKKEALNRFGTLTLKDPASRLVLRLLQEDDLLSRITFVLNRDLLPNTLVMAESGSSAPSFELELGAVEQEEVSLVNGHLVRHVHRSRLLCVHDPSQAVRALRTFQGRLYVLLAFAREVPAWYRAVAEPNPALPMPAEAQATIDGMLRQILRDQVDLAVYAILWRHEVDQALAQRDKDRFQRSARLYNQLRSRCLIEL